MAAMSGTLRAILTCRAVGVAWVMSGACLAVGRLDPASAEDEGGASSKSNSEGPGPN